MVDATFGAPAHRDAFLAGLRTDGCAQDLAARVATWIDGSP